MDFLKTCFTNLSTILAGDITFTAYTVVNPEYEGTETETRESLDSAAERDRILAKILEQGSLAHWDPSSDLIWAFNLSPEVAESVLQYHNCSVVRQGSLDAQTLSNPSEGLKPSASSSHIHRLLSASIGASIRHALRDTWSLVPLGYLAWILVSAVEEKSGDSGQSHCPSQLLSLVTQASSSGSIFIIPKLTGTELVCLGITSVRGSLSGRLSGQRVIVAPSGKLAKIVDRPQPIASASDSVIPNRGTSSKRQRMIARARFAQEKKEKALRELIQSKLREVDAFGMNPDTFETKAANWLWLEMPGCRGSLSADATERSFVIFPWPANLCFTTRKCIEPADVNGAPFSKGSLLERVGTYEGPISQAEAWQMSSVEREGAVSEWRKSTLRRDTGDSEDLGADSSLDFSASPLYQRGLEPPVAAGVYPTPPDGIPTASMDAAMTSTATDGPSSEVRRESRPRQRELSQESSVNLDTDDHQSTTADLFGDIDEEMFGGPDVTDADFSFFDDAGALSASVPSRNGGSATQSMNAIMEDAAETGAMDDRGFEDPPPSIEQEDISAVSARSLPTQGSETPLEPVTPSGLSMSAYQDRLDCTHLDAAPSLVYGTGPAGVATPPLSPFAIKEKLLPLPIPASSTRSGPVGKDALHKNARRDSNFGAVAFSQGMGFTNAKYGISGRFGTSNSNESTRLGHESDPATRPKTPNVGARTSIRLSERGTLKGAISKPSGFQTYGFRHRKSRSHRDRAGPEDLASSSEEDSGVETSGSEAGPKDTTWIPSRKKRKRILGDRAISPPAQNFDQLMSEIEDESDTSEHELSVAEHLKLTCSLLLFQTGQPLPANVNERASDSPLRSINSAQLLLGDSVDNCYDCWDLFDFDGDDYIAIAQLVMEQGLPSTTPSGNATNGSTGSVQRLAEGSSQYSSMSIRSAICSAIEHATDTVNNYAFTALASLSSTNASSSHDVQAKGQPRPTPRRSISVGGGPSYGQHLFPISPPFIRVRRAESNWDMLPPAIDFWEPLSLEPSSGPKHISAHAVVYGNEHVCKAAEDYLSDLGNAYEACKFGTHGSSTRSTSSRSFQGIVAFEPDEVLSPRSFLSGLRSACARLADRMSIGTEDNKMATSVVYIIDPFPDGTMTRFICACFWELCYRLRTTSFSTQSSPDIMLQILPLDVIAQQDTLVIADGMELSMLARTIYDRIMPSSLHRPTSTSSVWRIACAPSVELVSPVTRKINFQLNEKATNNLLQEGQILHVAYTVSADTYWLVVAWTDYAGRQQHSSAFHLGGADEQAVLLAVKDLTGSMLTDTATWRLFVAKVGTMGATDRQIWGDLARPNVAVTMLDVGVSPSLQVLPPQANNAEAGPSSTSLQPGIGFLTPVSTPQASNQTMSPEAQCTTAPPTPAASEPAQEAAPSDPDAHLVDPRDETWALVLPFSPAHSSIEDRPKRVLASGMLLKRGEPSIQQTLPSLGVDVVEHLPPQNQAGQGNWLSPRSPEYVLREVLVFYRGLGLLAKLRGLAGTADGTVPWHVATAINGSERLVGFF